MKSSAELRQELEEAEARERAELDARRNSVKPIMRFTIMPTDDKHERILDPSCVKYRLEGEVTNREELEAVGAAIRNEGGMNYLFNKLSGRIVMAMGGGQVYVGGSRWGGTDEGEQFTFDQLSAFITEHPEGGDVTGIVEEHRANRPKFR